MPCQRAAVADDGRSTCEPPVTLRLLFTYAGGEGHLQPLLPLACAAAAAGHDVAVSGAAALAPVVRAAGLRHLPSGPDVAPKRVPLRAADMERERRVLHDSFAGAGARERVRDLVAICGSRRPDVIVRDETDFGAAVVAELVNVRPASVVVLAAGSFSTPELVAEPLNRLRAEHGLAPDPDMEMLTRGLVLSPFPPSFRDPADPLPAGARTFRMSDTAPAVGGAGSLVYVTLGTIFNTESGDVFKRALDGVSRLPLDVVATVGRTMDPAELGPQRGNVRVERYVPQAELLPHCAAVVSHAGSGSVLGALEHGVPLVCVPIGADQPLNAARCTALGVGLALDAIAFTPDDARRAVSEVVGGARYREAAARLRAEIAAQPPARELVALLERLAPG